MEKKKILLVISSLNTGGAQRAFANMSLALSEKWDCDFLLNDSQNISYPYGGNILDLEIAPPKDRENLLYQLQVFIKRFRKLRQLKKSGEYCACISALTSANTVNVLTGNKYCKTVTSIRNYMSEIGKGFKGNLQCIAVKLLSNRSDYVVAVSESIREDLIQNFNVRQQKVVTIYNSYPVDRIREQAKEPLAEQEKQWFFPGRRYIVNVGRLHEQKDQSTLISAFHKISGKFEDCDLIILGEGELRNSLEEQIAKLSLQNRVYLPGFVQNPYRILDKCSLFVMSSLYEGFPNALAESLSVGVPVVSTDFDSGAREILAPDTAISVKVKKGFEMAEFGILCAVNTVDGLADGMAKILEDKQLYAKYQEKSKIRAEQLDVKINIEKWIHLIEA